MARTKLAVAESRCGARAARDLSTPRASSAACVSDTAWLRPFGPHTGGAVLAVVLAATPVALAGPDGTAGVGPATTGPIAAEPVATAAAPVGPTGEASVAVGLAAVEPVAEPPSDVEAAPTEASLSGVDAEEKTEPRPTSASPVKPGPVQRRAGPPPRGKRRKGPRGGEFGLRAQTAGVTNWVGLVGSGHYSRWFAAGAGAGVTFFLWPGTGPLLTLGAHAELRAPVGRTVALYLRARPGVVMGEDIGGATLGGDVGVDFHAAQGVGLRVFGGADRDRKSVV